jgi:hypothetical protein
MTQSNCCAIPVALETVEMIGLSPGHDWLVAAPLSVQGKRQSHYRTAPDGLPSEESFFDLL